MEFSKRPLVSIVMGSDSDLSTMKAAGDILTEFEIPFEITIVSAHRTPNRLYTYANNAMLKGFKVIIAGAGGAAHLPGMIAALTPLPVIGVPVKSSALSGVDSLYSICQMPKGIPVATMAIGNAYNAGLMAVRMLGIEQPNLLKKMDTWMKTQTSIVENKVIQWKDILGDNNENYKNINELII